MALERVDGGGGDDALAGRAEGGIDEHDEDKNRGKEDDGNDVEEGTVRPRSRSRRQHPSPRWEVRVTHRRARTHEGWDSSIEREPEGSKTQKWREIYRRANKPTETSMQCTCLRTILFYVG